MFLERSSTSVISDILLGSGSVAMFVVEQFRYCNCTGSHNDICIDFHTGEEWLKKIWNIKVEQMRILDLKKIV